MAVVNGLQPDSAVNVREAIDQYTEKGRLAKSLTNHNNRVRSIRQALGGYDEMLLHDLAEKQLAEIADRAAGRIDTRTGEVISPCTAKNDMRHLKDFLAWCSEQGWWIANDAINGFMRSRLRELEADCRDTKAVVATPVDIHNLGLHADVPQLGVLLITLNCGLKVHQAVGVTPWSVSLFSKAPALDLATYNAEGQIALWKPTVVALRLSLVGRLLNNRRMRQRLVAGFGINQPSQADLIEEARRQHRYEYGRHSELSESTALSYAESFCIDDQAVIRRKLYVHLVQSLYPGQFHVQRSENILANVMNSMSTASQRRSELFFFNLDAKATSESWKHLRDRAGVDAKITLQVIRRTMLSALSAQAAQTLRSVTRDSDGASVPTASMLAGLNREIEGLHQMWQDVLPDALAKWRPTPYLWDE